MACFHAKCLYCKRFENIRDAQDEITEDLDIVGTIEFLSNRKENQVEDAFNTELLEDD